MSQEEIVAENTEEPQTAHSNPNLRWYAILTQPSSEKRVISLLEERIRKFEQTHFFGRILIPTQFVEKIDEKGKKTKIEQKIMPGYLFIQMEMNDTTYHIVKDIPKVTNFLGSSKLSKIPPAMPDGEVERLLNQAQNLTKNVIIKSKLQFDKGERVKVIDGPFTNFVGDVDEVKPDKQKLKLLVSVFGRLTPVELDYSKVEKITES